MKPSTPRITDANVRRLQQLQDAVDASFSAHVRRHKAEIERHNTYFRESFPLLGLNHRAQEKEATELKEEERQMNAKKDSADRMPESCDAGTERATAGKSALNRRQRRQDRRWRDLRRRPDKPSLHTSPSAPEPLPPQDASAGPQTFPAATDPAAEEETRVLDEIAKFEDLLVTKKLPATPLAAPQEAPLPTPAPGTSPTRPAKRGFSFGALFDLKPRFRDLRAENGDDAER